MQKWSEEVLCSMDPSFIAKAPPKPKTPKSLGDIMDHLDHIAADGAADYFDGVEHMDLEAALEEVLESEYPDHPAGADGAGGPPGVLMLMVHLVVLMLMSTWRLSLLLLLSPSICCLARMCVALVSQTCPWGHLTHCGLRTMTRCGASQMAWIACTELRRGLWSQVAFAMLGPLRDGHAMIPVPARFASTATCRCCWWMGSRSL